jgi:hypothetical protein
MFPQMSEHKSRPLRSTVFSKESETSKSTSAANADKQGWEAYRKWLSRVATKPTTERAPLDPSIYSWRGYHNWADKVRQSWKSESADHDASVGTATVRRS